MATTQGEKVTWADIQSIYTSLNNCQNKFGITKTAVPSNPGLVKPDVISNLKTAIFSLKGSRYVDTSFVSGVFNLTVPTAGTLIKPAPFDTMESTLSTVFGLCAQDSFCGFGACGDITDVGYHCFAGAGCSQDFYCNAQF